MRAKVAFAISWVWLSVVGGEVQILFGKGGSGGLGIELSHGGGGMPLVVGLEFYDGETPLRRGRVECFWKER